MRSLLGCSRRHPARREFLSFFRPLGVEPLESRLAPAILTVNSLADGPIDLSDATVTLRDAIHAANEDVAVSPGGPSGSGADEIRFQAGLSGPILLTQDQLGLRSDLTISGPGANVLTVNGNNAFTVFDVADFTEIPRSVTISGLTITLGAAPVSFGGGIINRENLTVQNCTIIANSAGLGGGGIHNTATLTVQNSTISGNTSGGDGGGIRNEGTLTVQNSTISGNFAAGTGAGGGLFITGNTTVQNCTITANSAADGGSGIYTFGITVLHNTIVADNFVPSGAENNIFSGIGNVSGTNNLIGTGLGNGGFTNGVNGNQVGVEDPKLGGLADNGGPTKTHALLPGTPALNAGNNAQVPGFSFDQRGAPFARIFNVTVDIGAFEAQPISLIVDTNVDEADGNEGPGDLSLREAINRANANAGADTITFAAAFFNTPRVISLGLSQLAIRDDLTITGPGVALLTVNGNNASRVFEVDDLAASSITVSMKGLTISGGNAFTLTGGGIFTRENLTLQDSAISGNSSLSIGGAIRNTETGALTLRNCIVSGNSAADGGGVWAEGAVTVENSTISSNRVMGGGAGIYSFSGATTFRSATITQNHSDNDNSGAEPGGGIFMGSSEVTLHNTIVADNFRGNGTTTDDDIGSFEATPNISGTNNLIGTGGSGGLTNGNSGNQVGVADPKLGALANNGGPTKTHALLPGSPAIDTGNNGQVPADAFDLDGDSDVAEPIPFDQRGSSFARIVNNTVDIGSFEVPLSFPWHNFAKPLDVNADGSRTSIDALIIFNRLNGVGPGAVPSDAQFGIPFFYDPSHDNFVSSLDALLVINYLNAGGASEGEGGVTSAQPQAHAFLAEAGNQQPSLPPVRPMQTDLADIISLLASDTAAQSPRRRQR